jgi:hypothetical protein
MYSLSIDYLFNRVYDVLLWIKYVWLFDILHRDPEAYLEVNKNSELDGLRDRGWFDTYFATKNQAVPAPDTHLSLWHQFLNWLPFGNPKTVIDQSTLNTLTRAQFKERYGEYYTFDDKLRDLFGLSPKDSNGNGVPDSYEITHGVNPDNSTTQSFDPTAHTQGLHFAIQNPILSFFADLLSVAVIVVLIVLVYTSFRWFLSFISALHHYNHHFGHTKHTDLHVIEAPAKHDGHVYDSIFPAGLAIQEESETPAAPPTPQAFVDNPRFAIIQGYMSSQNEALWRIGILEADTMLDHVLREKGYQGNTMSELLKSANFKTIQLAWDAHLVRNRIAHEGSAFELTEREAKRTFNLYESVFRELKAIN